MLWRLSSLHLKGAGGRKPVPQAVENSSFQGVPRQASSQAQPLSYSSLLSPALGSSMYSMRPLSRYPGAPVWTSGQCWASLSEASHISFLLHQNIPLVRPALRNQSSRTFFLQRAAQPTLAWEKGLKRKPTAFKTGTKVQQKCPKPFEINCSKRGLQSFKLPVTAGHP